MFETLPKFYASDTWRKFRRQLINDRTNKTDGVLYCEHSGVPLINNYDIVAHHIKPLTSANVNDHSVSLNPENIKLVSQQAHNEIHARFGFGADKKVFYVYGAPCSGKTTFVQNVKGNSDLVVDIDNIWECITGGARYDKPPALKAVAFGLKDELLDMVKTRTGKWERAFIIEGGAARFERERKLAVLGAEPIFIDTDKETCLKRLRNDCNRLETHKKEWATYIERWFEDFTE